MSLRRIALLFAVVLLAVVLSATLTLAAPPAGEPVTPQPVASSDRYPAEVDLATRADLDTLLRLDIDVANVRRADETALFPGPDDPFVPLVATVYINEREAAALAAEGLVARPIVIEQPSGWPTYDQFVARMQALATNYPAIVRVVSLGQSVQGRELWAIKLTDNPDVDEDEPEVRYLSTMHGIEPVGTELTLRLAELLAASYGVDPDLTTMVDEMEIWLMPLVNPDGYVNNTYENANGVNLNRDFPDRITDPVDDPAGREPETQAIMNWTYGRHFVMGANYHTGSLVVNYPWDSVPATPDYAPDDALYYDYSVGYAVRNPMIWNGGFPNGVTRGWEWYIIRGGLQDWAYHWQGEHHVTIELSNQQPPPYSQMDTYWNNNREAMLWWMRRALAGARGLVTDASTGDPLDAIVDVVQIGKPVYTDPAVGDYHRLLLTGTYTLTASAYCYESLSASVNVSGTEAAVRNFALSPSPNWTVQGTVTEEGSGLPLSATVEFLDSPVTVYTNPATGHYAAQLCGGTYTMRVSAPGHRSEEREVVVDGDQVQDFVLEPAPCTLLVDDDTGDDYETYYANALAAAGQEYDLWTVTTQGSPTAADLAGYGRVVWLTGDDYQTTLTASDQAALASYLDGGGRLFVSGQDIGYDIGSSPFYANYLHAQYVADDTNDTSLTGLDFLAGADVVIAGGDGANNQDFPSQINPAGGSVAVYDYSSGIYGGVAYQDATYGVVYFAFGFEGINNAADRTEVMSRTLAWLGGCPGTDYLVWAGDSEAAGAPGETVTHTFIITNMGTVSDTYLLSLTPGNWPATLLDAQVGPLDPLESGQARVTVEIPALLPGEALLATDLLTLTVTSAAEPQVGAQAQGTTHAVADLSLALAVDDPHREVLPGQAVTYTLAVTNSGSYTDAYALSLSGNDWPTSVTPGQTPPLAPGQAAVALVRVEVPATPAIPTDTVTVRAASGWDASLYAEQELRTRAVTGLDVTLGVTLDSQAGLGGQVVTYSLILQNSGDYTDTYTLSLDGVGWPSQLVPFDNGALRPGVSVKAGFVRVEIPDGLPGERDVITVTATSSWDAGVQSAQVLTTTRLGGVYLPLVRR
jgi:hypothetical protein